MDKAKSTLVKFWLSKAQRDLAVAKKLASDFPDIAIYHCQQGAEKALKGFLIFHDVEPGNTHNINSLLQEASVFNPELKIELFAAGLLTQYNQAYRYPGNPTEDFNPSAGELKRAYRIALDVYKKVLDTMPKEIVGQPQQSQSASEQQRDQESDLEL